MTCCLCLGLLSSLAGCDLSRVEWEPHVGPQVFYDAQTQSRAVPIFHAWPVNGTAKPATALILPFSVSQDMSSADRIGAAVARVFWQTWREEEVFSSLRLSRSLERMDLQAALRQARELGCEVVILGDVTYLLVGGSNGPTSLALRLDILSAASGEEIWSMEHAGRIEFVMDQDYMVFTKKVRMPEAPELVIVQDLARDLAGPVKAWRRPVLKKEPATHAANATQAQSPLFSPSP